MKMSIYIYTNAPLGESLKEIQAGVEEEGALSEVFSSHLSGQERLANAAAAASPLGCGIGIDRDKAVLQFVGVPIDAVLFYDEYGYRKLGANAARLVMKKTLRLSGHGFAEQ